MTHALSSNAAALLQTYEPADKQQEHVRLRCLQLLTTGSPFSRRQFSPGHFTASAFVLSPEQSSVLMIFHAKLQRWLQPGGHIDSSDDGIVQAAGRELLEETGLAPDSVHLLSQGLFDIDVHRIPANIAKKEDPHEHFDLRILLLSNSRHLLANSDALGAQWTPFAALERINTDHSVRRVVQKIRGKVSAR